MKDNPTSGAAQAPTLQEIPTLQQIPTLGDLQKAAFAKSLPAGFPNDYWHVRSTRKQPV